MTEKKSVIPSADLATRLIELFYRKGCPLRLTEVVLSSNSNQATTIRLLSVFEENDWIRCVEPLNAEILS